MRRLFALALLFAQPAFAEVPKIVTSITPVQGMVADVMGNLGTPVLLLEGAQSPHDFALRPSQVRAISGADLVFRIGAGAEPWLERIWSDDPRMITLSDTAGLHLLPMREAAVWSDEEHQHADEDDEMLDSHLWLNPTNATRILHEIAEYLAAADPENAAIYRANAARVAGETLDAFESAKVRLAALPETKFIVTHDSMQYFEVAFGLHGLGALGLADGQKPGARSLSALVSAAGNTVCILADVSHPSNWAEEALPEARTVPIDPLGTDLLSQPGYAEYLILSLTEALENCAP